MADSVATPTVGTQRSIDISMVEHTLASYSAEMRTKALLAIGASSRKVLGWIVYSSPDTSYCDIICEGSFDITFAASTDYFLVTDIRAAEPPATERSGGFVVLRGDLIVQMKMRAFQVGLLQQLEDVLPPEPTQEFWNDVQEQIAVLTEDFTSIYSKVIADGDCAIPFPFAHLVNKDPRERVIYTSWDFDVGTLSAECMASSVSGSGPSCISYFGEIKGRRDASRPTQELGFITIRGPHRPGTTCLGGGLRLDQNSMDRLATAWDNFPTCSANVDGIYLARTTVQAGTILSHGMTCDAHVTDLRVPSVLQNMPDNEAAFPLARAPINGIETRKINAMRRVASGAGGWASFQGNPGKPCGGKGKGLPGRTLDCIGAMDLTAHRSGDGEAGLQLHDAAHRPEGVRASKVDAIHCLSQVIDESHLGLAIPGLKQTHWRDAARPA